MRCFPNFECNCIWKGSRTLHFTSKYFLYESYNSSAHCAIQTQLNSYFEHLEFQLWHFQEIHYERVTIPFFLLALVINVTRSWPTVNKIFFQVLIFCLGVKNWFQLHKLKLSFSASLWFQVANHDDFTENKYSGLRVLRPKPVFY